MTHPIYKGYEDEDPIKKVKGTRSAADATRTNVVQASMDSDAKSRKAKTLRSSADSAMKAEEDKYYGGSPYDSPPPIHVVMPEKLPEEQKARKAEKEAKEAKAKLPPGKR